MFPEIMRDEVFRLETQHAWLRWPVCADVDRVDAILAHGLKESGSGRPSVLASGTSATLIGRWRVANAAGQALHLMIVPKTPARLPAGLIGIAPGPDTEPELSFAVNSDRQDTRLLAEAAAALVDTAFLFGGLRNLVAVPVQADLDAGILLTDLGFSFERGEVGRGEGADVRLLYLLDRSEWRRRRGPTWFPGSRADAFAAALGP